MKQPCRAEFRDGEPAAVTVMVGNVTFQNTDLGMLLKRRLWGGVLKSAPAQWVSRIAMLTWDQRKSTPVTLL